MNDDLILKMILDESGFTAGMNSAVKKLGSFDNTVSDTSKKSGNSMGSIWKVFAGSFLASGATKIISTGFNMVKNSVDGAIDRFDTLNKYPTVMNALGYSTKEVDNSMKKLTSGIEGLPTSLNDIVSGAQQFAISSGSLDKGTDYAIAFNNAMLTSGASTAAAEGALTQFSQALGKGKLQGDEFNSVASASPILMSRMADAFGFGAKGTAQLKDALSSGKISAQEFADKMVELNKGTGGFAELARKNSAGIKTSFANIKTAVVKGVANVITAVNDGMSKAGFGSIAENFDKVKDVVNVAFGKIVEIIPPALEALSEVIDVISHGIEIIKPFAPVLLTVIGAIGTYQAIMGTAKKAVEGYTAVQEIMNSVMNANPYVLIISSIIAVTGLIIYLWKTNEGFRKAVISIWENIKSAFSDAATYVKKVWAGTKEFFADLWSGIKNTAKAATDGIKNVWSGVKEWFSNLWNSIKETASNAWNTFKTVVIQPIAEVVQEIVSVFSSIVDFLVGIWTNLIEIGGSYFEILKNVILAPILFVTSMITGGWSETRDNMIAVWNNIKENALNIWNSIKNLFTIVTGAMVSVGKIIWNSIKAFFVTTWNAIKSTASNTWNAIKDTMINTWNSIKQNFWNIVSGIVQSAENAWTNLKNGVSNTVDRVWNIFDSLRNINLFEIGRNIIQGLIDGLAAKFNHLKKKVKDIASLVKGVVTGDLDINSPSRWMRDMVGKNIVQGIIVGLDKEQPQLDKAMTDLVPTPSVTPTVRSLTDRPVGVTQNKTESQSTEVHFHLNVYGDLPDSVIKKLAAKLKTEFTKQMKRDADAVGGMA
ncbi:tape measure protein [Enterococcus avium]|uniref:tape measure protein n=1 Tax=Enterococcus avium TaxID=33945 RepID=UPI003515A7F5